MIQLIIQGTLLVTASSYGSAAPEASFANEAAVHGHLWPLDVVGAQVSSLIHDTFRFAQGLFASTQNTAVKATLRELDASKSSTPSSYWADEIKGPGVFSVHLNSELQVKPGSKVSPSENVPIASRSQFWPLEAVKSFFQRFQAMSEIEHLPSKQIDDESTTVGDATKLRGASNTSSELQANEFKTAEETTSEGVPSHFFSHFRPLDAIASLFRAKPSVPLDLPELTATKMQITSKDSRDNRTNDTGIIVVALSSELQTNESTAGKKLRGNHQHPARFRADAIQFLIAMCLLVGVMHLASSCSTLAHGLPLSLVEAHRRNCSSAPTAAVKASSELVLTPRSMAGSQYGACGPSHPSIVKDALCPQARDDAASDVTVIRGSF